MRLTPLRSLRLPILAILLVGFFAAATAPAAAQAQDPPPAPVDLTEAGGVDVAPLRIGPMTLSGSAWFEGLATAGDDRNEAIDTLRVRRARIGLAGNLTPKIGWNISGELTSQPALRNAFLIFRFTDQFNVRVGQAGPPNGLERTTSPLAIELIDRSLLTRRLTYPFDNGVTLMNGRPYRGWVSYALSMVNGTGVNKSDDNDAKEVVGRLGISPPGVRGLSIVASGGTGKAREGGSSLAGLGAAYDVPAFKILLEGLRRTFDRLPTSEGVVALAAYRIRPATVTPHFRMLELAARFVVLHDPSSASGQRRNVVDEDSPDEPAPGGFTPSTIRELQAGGNYYVNRNVRFMVNLIVPVDERTSPDLTLMTRLQLVF